MKIVIIIFLMIGVFFAYLKWKMIKYFNQKLKDMNEGNIK